MFSYPAYVLLGDDRTGKTSFQKFLIEILCRRSYDRLPTNLLSQIVHPRMPRGCSTLLSMNRSFQEKLGEYVDMHNYFDHFFVGGDICIMSSHVHDPSIKDLTLMIDQLKIRCYNPIAVFFSNGYDNQAKSISLLDWHERLWVDNPNCETEELFLKQIRYAAEEFVNLLIARASLS